MVLFAFWKLSLKLIFQLFYQLVSCHHNLNLKSFFFMIRLSLSLTSFCFRDVISFVTSARKDIKGSQAFFSAHLPCLWTLHSFLLCFVCFYFCLPYWVLSSDIRWSFVFLSFITKRFWKVPWALGASRDEAGVGLTVGWMSRDHTFGNTQIAVMRDLVWGGGRGGIMFL